MHSILLSNLVAHSDSAGFVATSCPKLGLLDSAAGTDWPRPQFGFLLWQGGGTGYEFPSGGRSST
jgi:hypothetical protein